MEGEKSGIEQSRISLWDSMLLHHTYIVLKEGSTSVIFWPVLGQTNFTAYYTVHALKSYHL